MGQEDSEKSVPTGRELFRRRSEFITAPPGGVVAGRKSNPERLIKFLNNLIQFRGVIVACEMSGFSYSSLRSYLAKSETGKRGDGFDLTYAEETKRFHLHYADALQEGIQRIEDAYKRRALDGYYETLHDKGRVIYQIDPELEGLGLTGSDAYLRDQDGKPIPERIHHQDPEVMLAVLRAWRRDTYGRHEQVDVSVRGGVMVVGFKANSSESIEKIEKGLLSDPVDVEFREVEDE